MRYLLVILCLLIGSTAWPAPTALTVISSGDSATLGGASYVDAQKGNSVANLGENVILAFHNTSSSTTNTVTIAAQQTSFTIAGVGTVTKSNIVQAMAPLTDYIVGPLAAQAWNDGSGNIQVTYSGGASSLLTVYPITSTKLLKIP